MTKVIEIDCDKWKKIIGVTLWSLATIGLGFGIYLLSNNVTLKDNMSCFPRCYTDGGSFFYVLWFITLIINISNIIGIWYHLIHKKYRLIEFRCKNK